MAEHVCACSCVCFCEGVEGKPDLGCTKPCAALLAAPTGEGDRRG